LSHSTRTLLPAMEQWELTYVDQDKY
jgi:hypothetical protein